VEGDLSTVPLMDTLELLHGEAKSGRLLIRADVPLFLRFRHGEIVGGGILDWEGFEAIATFDLASREGRFRFVAGEEEGTPLFPFRTLVAEWARLSDEWRRFRTQVDAPSRVLEAPRASGTYAVFSPRLSVRGAAKRWGVPLIIAMERVWRGVLEGELVPLAFYRWFTMKVRHPLAGRRRLRHPFADVVSRLDGRRTLGELIQDGLPLDRVRAFLIEEIRAGKLKPPGRGALLRDLTWENG